MGALSWLVMLIFLIGMRAFLHSLLRQMAPFNRMWIRLNCQRKIYVSCVSAISMARRLKFSVNGAMARCISDLAKRWCADAALF